jgi:hypothetical protein
MSSRLIPAWTAVFHPMVIDMSMLGASGRFGWVGGVHGSTHSPSTRKRLLGAVDEECTPPAITSSSMPARMLPAAFATADSPAAQCRLSACPGTLASPEVSAACRARTPPP